MTGEIGEFPQQSYEFLDRPEVTRVLFHPRRDLDGIPASPHVRSVRVEVEQGIAVSGRLHRATVGGPTILFFHGNGEIAADYDSIGPLFTGLGINLLVMDYRGYGLSDGQPTATHLIADAVTVYEEIDDLLAEHDLRHERLFVMGRSLGSAAAIEIAARAGDEIAGLIIESGFAHTRPLLITLGLRWEMGETGETRDGPTHLPGKPGDAGEPAKVGFGNLDKIARVRVPTLIIHGETDWLIPVENGRALHAHCAAEDKRLVTIPRAGHNDLLFVGQTAYFGAIRSFVRVKGT